MRPIPLRCFPGCSTWVSRGDDGAAPCQRPSQSETQQHWPGNVYSGWRQGHGWWSATVFHRSVFCGNHAGSLQGCYKGRDTMICSATLQQIAVSETLFRKNLGLITIFEKSRIFVKIFRNFDLNKNFPKISTSDKISDKFWFQSKFSKSSIWFKIFEKFRIFVIFFWKFWFLWNCRKITILVKIFEKSRFCTIFGNHDLTQIVEKSQFF